MMMKKVNKINESALPVKSQPNDCNSPLTPQFEKIKGDATNNIRLLQQNQSKLNMQIAVS